MSDIFFMYMSHGEENNLQQHPQGLLGNQRKPPRRPRPKYQIHMLRCLPFASERISIYVLFLEAVLQ